MDAEGRPGAVSGPRPWTALAALTLVAVLVRAIGLGGGLWYDEMVAIVEAYRLPLFVSLTTFSGDFHHPLYSVAARLGLVAFGDAAWAVRLPALLAGAATIPLAYALGREVAGTREAWLSAGLLAVFYPHVWFSQNARGYTLLAFWSTLATLLLVRHLRRDAARVPLGYAAVLALGVYTHLTMVFLAVGHALVCAALAWRRRWEGGRIRALALGFALGATLTLVLYGPMLGQVVDFFLHRPSQLVGVSTPLWALGEALAVLRRGLGAGTLVGVLVAAGLFSIGVASYARRTPGVAALFLMPAVVTVIGAALARGTMYPRFFFFMVVFLLLVLVRGTVVAGDWLGRRLVPGRPAADRIGPALVGLMLAASLLGLTHNYRYPKQDYEGAIAFVESRAAQSDAIVTTGDGAWPLRGFYGRDYPLIETVADLERARAVGGRVWMVFTFPLYIEAAAPEMMEVIDEGCGERTVFPGTIGGGDVIVCSFPPLSSDG